MFRLCLIYLFSLTLLVAQDENGVSPNSALSDDETTPPIAAKNNQEESVEILDNILEQIQSLESPSSALELDSDENTAALERLRLKFNELVVGKESLNYFSEEQAETSIQQELVEIFDPLIGEVKSATATSREKDALRNQIELLLQRKEAIDVALNRIRQLLITARANKSQNNTELVAKLEALEKVWASRKEQAQLEYESAKIQLEEKAANSSNAVETASRTIAKFFKTRGLHLLIGIISAIAVFCLLHYGYRYLTKYSPTHNKEELHGTSKFLDGVMHLLTLFLTCFTLLLAFFLCDDWVLLSASLLVFIGIIWALKDKLAELTEEIRLILNIGAVREGERIYYEGLSWQVEKIRAYSRIVNPELDGGRMRIPISSMVGLRSRPCNNKERYFPTSTNDWVILADETFGKVVRQTPNHIELIKLGGSRKTYLTQDFLALSPENLSIAQFRITSSFGVDYKHQSTVTTEITEQLQTFIKKRLVEEMDHKDQLKKLNVEFANAGASSLDFVILADFSSAVAPQYNILKRKVQRLAVEACNEYGWEIPFNQLTIHQV